MEQQYKTDAEIYAVLEREIIDLTIRPGSSLSENPLCARFGAPRSLIRVVLQKLQENVATAALCAVFAVFHKEKISFP